MVQVSSGQSNLGLGATIRRDIARSFDPHGEVAPTTRQSIEQLVFSPELRLVVAFRLYSWLAEHVRWSLGYAAYMYTRGRTGCDLALGAMIGPGLRVEHRSDIVVGTSAVLGEDIDLYNGVTVGKRRPPPKGNENEMPTVGDRVMLGAGCKLLGDITIGDDAVVAANAVVIDNVEAGATVVGIPARPVGRDGGA